MIVADIVMALIGLAGLVIFTGIIVYFVPQTPLVVVVAVVLVMVAIDFFIEIRHHMRDRQT